MARKIKLIMIAASLSINGISTIIMNYCGSIDSTHFDTTIMAGIPIDTAYRKECDLKGIHLIELPSKKGDAKEYYRHLWKSLAEGYDIVHVHGSSAIIAIELLLAFFRGIKIRFAHCHNTTCSHIYIHKGLKPLFNCLYTKGFACSSLAGKWLFGNKKIEIIPNSFEITKYRFDEKNRREIREKLHLGTQMLIGHIGRFNDQKNQLFILKVFEKIAATNPEAHLILVGTGPDFDKINQLVLSSAYCNRIILYGETLEPQKMYAAMDAFVFPSRHEGLPVVLLEAQISGLPCIVSDRVTQEVDFGDICWKSIEEEPEAWARAVLTELEKPVSRYGCFDVHKDQMEEYDIAKSVKHLEQIYLDAYENHK